MTRRVSDKTPPPRLSPTRPMNWRRRRLLLGALAVAGTAAYVASFRTLPGAASDRLGAAAAAVGAAAAGSWLVFGCLLLVAHRRPPLAWADACLRTMAAGVVALGLGAALNLGAGSFGVASAGLLTGAQLAVLGAGNVVMAAVFCRESRRLGVRPAAAVVAWACGLDGVFALILLSLYRNGAFVP